jgi:hypothetical protein
MKILFISDKPSKGAKHEKRCKDYILKVVEEGDQVCLINSTNKFLGMYLKYYVSTNLPIVTFGNNASDAIEPVMHFKLSHPSGLNRRNSDKKLIDSKLKECKIYIDSHRRLE